MQSNALLRNSGMTIRQAIAGLFILCMYSAPSFSQIHIAVASNFKPTLELLISDYMQFRIENGLAPIKITVSSGSTGTLFAQISHGAPFDLLMAADSASVDRLQQQLNLPEKNAFVYAIGALVFHCQENAPHNLHMLTEWQGSYGQANEKLAPYGRATTEVVNQLNWVGNSVITATNVAQVSHFIATGAIDCGFTAKSLLSPETETRQYFDIPSDMHQPIVQKALVLTPNHVEYVDEFKQYVVNQGLEIIRKSGYLTAHE